MLILIMIWLTGLLLGIIFYGGLWWTIRFAVKSRRPALCFLSSLLLRAGICLTGFYLVSGPDWRRWLLCLFGFVVARILVTLLTRTSTAKPTGLVKDS